MDSVASARAAPRRVTASSQRAKPIHLHYLQMALAERFARQAEIYATFMAAALDSKVWSDDAVLGAVTTRDRGTAGGDGAG